MESTNLETDWKHSPIEASKMDEIDLRAEIWAIQAAVQGYFCSSTDLKLDDISKR